MSQEIFYEDYLLRFFAAFFFAATFFFAILVILDLLRKDFSAAISRFRLRLCKNYSTYTPYMLHNFCFASLEI